MTKPGREAAERGIPTAEFQPAGASFPFSRFGFASIAVTTRHANFTPLIHI